MVSERPAFRKVQLVRIGTIVRCLFALLIVALLGWQPGPSAAAAEPITMTVRAGFDGMARVGSWLPVELQIANRGPDVSGQLELQVDAGADAGSFTQPAVIRSTPAVLPRYSQKRFVVEIYVPTVANRVTARLSTNGNVLTERDVPLETVPSGELLCGVVSNNPAALDFLAAIPLTARQRGARLAHLDVADIPSRPQVLGGLDCLILSNISGGSLSEQQSSAVHSWMTAGGLLVAVGGPGWQKTLGTLPPELLPVKITGTVPVQSLESLAAFGQGPIKDGPWLASQAEPTDGTVVLAEQGAPILVGGKRGDGVVYYLALDPASEPLRSWAGAETLWRFILSNASAAASSPGSASRQYSGWGSTPREALTDISDVKPPSGRELGFVFLGYLLFVPASYFGLRRLGRPELTAGAAAVAIVLAGAVSFALANAGREADVVVKEITVVRSYDTTSLAQTHSYVGVFAPQSVSRDIVAPADALVQSLYVPWPQGRISRTTPTPNDWQLRIADGVRPTISSFQVPAGRFGTLAVDSVTPSIPIRGDLLIDDQHISGTVTNESDKTLQDAALVVGHEVALLGTLRPGQSRQVDFNLTQDSPVSYLSLDEVVRALFPNADPFTPLEPATAIQREIVDSAINSSYSTYRRLDIGAVAVIGWLPSTPVPLEFVDTKTADLQSTLLVSSITPRFVPGHYARLSPGLIERRPMSVSAGTRLQEDSLSLNGGDTTATEYSLPVAAREFSVDSLALEMEGTLSGSGDAEADHALGSASVFDWEKADWVEVPVSFGQNALPEPQRFVSPLGTIRVRYSFRQSDLSRSSESAHLELNKFDIAVGGQMQ